MVLATCIVLRGCGKRLLRGGLHVMPLPHPLWGRFSQNYSNKPVFSVGSLFFYVFALWKNLQCPLPLRFPREGYLFHFPGRLSTWELNLRFYGLLPARRKLEISKLVDCYHHQMNFVFTRKIENGTISNFQTHDLWLKEYHIIPFL